MKLSDYVVKFLIKENITHVFEICGGAVTHLLDSLYGRKKILTLSMHHEQAAAFAAEGYSRTNGNIGVAMATSGPGATNLITGIGSCFFDSIPALFITGQVNTYEFKFNQPVRQIGFQETDIVSIVRPIVKDVVLIKDAKKIRYCLEKAVYIAKTGRPGPVLLDIPMNIQRADINPKLLKSFNIPYQRKSSNVLNQKLIKRIREFLNASSRPIVLIGGGVRLAKAGDELFRLIKKTEVPVVSSLMGLDAFPHDHPSFVGMFGSYGNRYANLAVANSDLILALGIRLDTRQTGTNPKTFARFAKIIHVDIDRYELNNKVKVDIAINSDLKVFLKTLNSKLTSFDKQRITPWLKRISAYKKKYPSFQNYRGKVIEPNFFIHKLSEFIPQGAVVCVDVGQNQMWAAQSLKLAKSQRFLTQGGMGAMGSALSMAIGAACTQPRKTIVVITGDGGFQLNSQELQTVYHHKLPIKIILLNNRCYGMVRQFQEQYFKSRLQSTVIGYSEPDFQKVVSAYKIKTAKITKKNQITKALNKLFKTKTPEFLEIGIEPCSKVLPKLSVNRPLEEQDPLLSYKELKSNMIVELL